MKKHYKIRPAAFINTNTLTDLHPLLLLSLQGQQLLLLAFELLLALLQRGLQGLEVAPIALLDRELQRRRVGLLLLLLDCELEGGLLGLLLLPCV